RVAVDSAHASTSSGFPAGRGAVDPWGRHGSHESVLCSVGYGGARAMAPPNIFGSAPIRAAVHWTRATAQKARRNNGREGLQDKGVREGGDVRGAGDEGDDLTGGAAEAGASGTPTLRERSQTG